MARSWRPCKGRVQIAIAPSKFSPAPGQNGHSLERHDELDTINVPALEPFVISDEQNPR